MTIMNEAQRNASKENYALFQIAGAVGNLTIAGNRINTKDAHINTALYHIREAIHSLTQAKNLIKQAQTNRKQRVKKL